MLLSDSSNAVGLANGQGPLSNASKYERHFDECVVDHEQSWGAGKLCATTLSIPSSLYRSLGRYRTAGTPPSFLKETRRSGWKERTREHASICTLMKVLSITNRPAGQASCAQQLSLSRCIDRSVYIPLHFSRRSQTRASSLCCRKCNQVLLIASAFHRCGTSGDERSVQGEGVNPGAAFSEPHEKRGNGKMSNHACMPRRHAQ